MASLDTPPGWAFSWCWYFFLSSCMSAITAVLAIFIIVTMYKKLSEMKDGSGVIPLSIFAASLIINSITSMVTFWMCRSSLKSKA